VKHSNAQPSTINVTEPVRLCAFAPPRSSLDRQSVIVFPRSVNNPASFHLTIAGSGPSASWIYFVKSSRLHHGRTKIIFRCGIPASLKTGPVQRKSNIS
jgi:hypothetical protein